jgi:FkbM family methyltransferase
VEVGAARPDYLSISAHFRAKGWTVLAIEPNPAYGEHYNRRGFQLLQYACGDHDEDDVDFVVVDSHGTAYAGGDVSYESWSSLAIKDEYRSLKPDLDTSTIKVKLRRLDWILETHAPEVDAIDIVAIDVEGWELEVLRGLDFARYKPSVLIVENLFVTASYRAFMAERGYVLWRRASPNDVYVRRELLGSIELLIARLLGGITTLTGRSRVLLERRLRANRQRRSAHRIGTT